MSKLWNVIGLQSFIALDLETTGLDQGQTKLLSLVQFGLNKAGRLTDSVSSLTH